MVGGESVARPALEFSMNCLLHHLLYRNHWLVSVVEVVHHSELLELHLEDAFAAVADC